MDVQGGDSSSVNDDSTARSIEVLNMLQALKRKASLMDPQKDSQQRESQCYTLAHAEKDKDRLAQSQAHARGMRSSASIHAVQPSYRSSNLRETITTTTTTTEGAPNFVDDNCLDQSSIMQRYVCRYSYSYVNYVIYKC